MPRPGVHQTAQVRHAAIGCSRRESGSRTTIPRRSFVNHRRRAASRFNYIILKLLTLPYTYFLGTETVSLCQDQLYVSRTHDVVRACDEDGGYRAVCDRGDHHRRTIRRHGWSARGNAASLSRPGLCVSGPRSQFHFHFFERGCEPRTEQRYGDLSHGLCSDRPTTLDVAQHIPCICNVAGGRFGSAPSNGPHGRHLLSTSSYSPLVPSSSSHFASYASHEPHDPGTTSCYERVWWLR